MPNLFDYEDPDFYIFYAKDEHPEPDRFAMHAHRDPEIFCFLSGKGQYSIEGTVYPLRPGDVLFMRTAETHMALIDQSEPYERLAFNLRPEFLDRLDPSGALWRMFFDRPLGTCNRYRLACTKDDTFFRFLQNLSKPGLPIRTVLLSRLLTILSEASVKYAAGAYAGATETEDERTGEIIRYLNTHLTDPLTLDGIAAHFFLSRSQLCRIFRKTTGSGVMEYVRIKRLMAAREQIASGISPSQAALACSFRDYSSFYRAYKDRFGVSPTKGE